MKKKIFYMMVVALALTMSSFTLTKRTNDGGYYWFPLESGSGFAKPVNRLVYQSFDPALCLNWGLGDYCSAAYTSYSGVSAPYTASGMEVIIDFNIIF